tara:strand:+ start:1074 stop:3269 length:2196 start_codon:yes stop_codon:yes gene_type:complete
MSVESDLWAKEYANNPMTEDELWALEDEKVDNRGSIRKGMDAIGDAVVAGADWVTGANVEPEIPMLSDIGVNRLATSFGGKSIITGVLAASSDDDRIKKAFQEAIPDAQFQQDKFGNLVVVAPTSRDDNSRPKTWERFYPNPSGADLATAYNVASVGALANPVNRLVGGGLTFTAAATAGAVEGGLLEAFSSFLANDKYDVLEVPKGAGGGLLSKPFVDIGGFLLSKIKGIVTSARTGDLPTGEAEKEIADALAEEGLNPNDVMDEVYRKMNTEVSAGAVPAESARYQTAQNLPVPVPMTRGDVSGEKGRQLLEDSIEAGNYGEGAAAQYANTRQAQKDAIEANLSNIQQQMAGPNGQVIDQRAGGMIAQEELVAAKAAQGLARDEAYTAARGSVAYIAPESGGQISGDILNNVRSRFSPTNAPQAFKMFNEEMAPLLQEGQSLKSIFEARQLLTNHSKQGGPEGAAASAMNRQLDNMLVDQANDLLLYGDSAAVTTWLDAIGKHKDFMKKWETNGILKELTSEGIRDGEMVLNKDPADVANAIFSVAVNPNRTKMTRDLITLKKELSTESWNSLRQEFFIKLSDKMIKANGDLKGSAFATNWAAVKKNTTLVNSLFTKAERANLDALASTAMRISSRAQNYSNSANSLLGSLRKFIDVLGPLPISKGVGDLPLVKQGMSAVGKGQLAVNPVGKAPSMMKKFLTTTGSATIGGAAIEGSASAILGNNGEQQ